MTDQQPEPSDLQPDLGDGVREDDAAEPTDAGSTHDDGDGEPRDDA